MTLHILGMGSYHPTTKITNQFLEDLGIGSEAAWIEAKIGIKERRSVLPLDYIRATKNKDPREAEAIMEETPGTLGIKAAEQALKRAGITAADVGMVICNSCTPTQTVPPQAISIAEGLGISGLSYDVVTACPAFALHVEHINACNEEELPDYILSVSTACLTQRVDYTNRSDSAIWGDGAAACIISPRKPGRLRVDASTYMSDPLRCHAVVVDTFGHFHQDGRAVRDFSVRQTVRMIKQMESEFPIDWERDVFIGHQANATMLEQIRNNRKIPHHSHWSNVDYIGNQAGAGAPAVLAEHWDQLQDDQRVVVAVVGAGLSWGSVLLTAV